MIDRWQRRRDPHVGDIDAQLGLGVTYAQIAEYLMRQSSTVFNPDALKAMLSKVRKEHDAPSEHDSENIDGSVSDNADHPGDEENVMS